MVLKITQNKVKITNFDCETILFLTGPELCMKILHKIKFDILISTKSLFYMKTSQNVSVKNEIVSQSKIRKTLMK